MLPRARAASVPMHLAPVDFGPEGLGSDPAAPLKPSRGIKPHYGKQLMNPRPPRTDARGRFLSTGFMCFSRGR